MTLRNCQNVQVRCGGLERAKELLTALGETVSLLLILASASILYKIPNRLRFGPSAEIPKPPRRVEDEPNARAPTHIHCHSNAGTRQPRHSRARVRLQRPQREPAEAAQCEPPSVQLRWPLPTTPLPEERLE